MYKYIFISVHTYKIYAVNIVLGSILFRMIKNYYLNFINEAFLTFCSL